MESEREILGASSDYAQYFSHKRIGITDAGGRNQSYEAENHNQSLFVAKSHDRPNRKSVVTE